MTSPSYSPAADGRQVHHDIGGSPARRRLARGGRQRSGRSTALTLLRPASASAAPTSSRHASTHAQRNLGREPRRSRISADRAAHSASIFLGELEGGGERRHRRQRPHRPARGTDGSDDDRSRRPGVQVARAPRSGGDPRTAPRPSRRATHRGWRPRPMRCHRWDGLGRGEAIDEGAQGQVGERRSRGFVHGLIVGGVRRPGTAGVMPRPDERRRRERARYRRARSAVHMAGVAGERPAAGRNVRCRMAPCQAARV